MVNSEVCFLIFMIYASKLITNQKWLFILYNLCDFTANTKQTLFYCIDRCTSAEYYKELDLSPGKYRYFQIYFDAIFDIKFMQNDQLSEYQ